MVTENTKNLTTDSMKLVVGFTHKHSFGLLYLDLNDAKDCF